MCIPDLYCEPRWSRGLWKEISLKQKPRINTLAMHHCWQFAKTRSRQKTRRNSFWLIWAPVFFRESILYEHRCKNWLEIGTATDIVIYTCMYTGIKKISIWCFLLRREKTSCLYWILDSWFNACALCIKHTLEFVAIFVNENNGFGVMAN